MSASLLFVTVVALATPLDEGDDQYQFIVGLADKGLHEQVVREAERFLERYGSHPKADLARYRLANALFDLERSAAARPHFASLAAVSGFRFADEVAFRHGQCELEAGAFDVAVAAFERVRRGAAEYLRTPATFLAGEAHFRAERYGDAARLYAETLAAEDAGEYVRDAVHGLAWCAFRTGQHDAAVQRCEEFLRRFQGDERAGEMAFLAGESHLEAGRPQPALEAYGRVRGGEFHAAALRGAGFACAELDDHAGAAARFGEVLARYPESRYAAEAALHRGIHLLRAGDPDAALVSLTGEAAGEDAQVCYWRGRAHAARGDHRAAQAAFERGLEHGPDEALAQRLQVGRGDALYDLGDGAGAAQAYQRAGSDYALHAAAVARLNDGHPDEAVRLASALLEGNPASPYRLEATLTLAEGHFAEERFETAEAAFAIVAREDEEPARRARATARLGWCRYRLDDPEGARARFEEVGERWPEASEAPEATFMVGRCAEELGDPAAAVQAYGRYLAVEPDGRQAAEATLRLARLEPDDAARARLAAFLAGAPDADRAAEAHHDLAERLSGAGEWAAAREHYAVVVEEHARHPLAPAARYGLAWCLYSEGQHGAALGHLSQLANQRDVDGELVASALELAVWAARGAERPDAARAAFAAFVGRTEDEQRRLRAARVAAGALRDGERIPEAEALYAELLEVTRDQAVAVAICVECTYLALDRGDLATAEAQARAAQRFAPEDQDLTEAFFFVGEAHFEAGSDAEAAQAYGFAAASPDPAVASRALYKQGFAHMRRGDHDGAARAFQALVEGHRQSELYGESLFLLGEAHFRAGRYAEAADWLVRVRGEAPGHAVLPKALFRLGEALVRTERYRPAAEALALLSKEHPDFPHLVEAELWRGRALAGLEQRRAARQAFERVTSRDRGVLAAQAHLELGRLFLAEGDRDEALSKFLFVAVLFAHPEEVAEALFMAGQVLEAKGELAAARERYAEAVADHGDTPFGARAKQRLEALGG